MIQVYDKYGKIKSSGIPGFGTVTAVSAGNLSPLFTTVVTSPTSTPNIAFTLTSQTQKLFFASPNSGSGTPTFRAIQASDLPSLSSTYVPVTRNITINGTTFDLSADRTWNVGTVTSVAALILGTTGTDLSSSVANSTTTPAITLNVPTASATNRGALSSTDWSTFNNKQDALVSGTNIRTIDDLAILGTGNLEYISNLIHKQNLGWMQPNNGNATYSFLKSSTNINLSGGSGTNAIPARLVYETAATAGGVCFARGLSGGSFAAASTVSFWWSRKFEITSNVANSRFVCALSNQFRLSNPTNVEPTTLINLIGVCKLSTSDNLHFIWNDATGTASTLDLGTNFPANNTTAYTYIFEIYKTFDSTNIVLKLSRIDVNGNVLTTQHTINSDTPALIMSAVIFGTNNTTASVFSFNDFGTVFKNYERQWDTI